MNILLNNIEARVLGSLIEKEITTPDYYPLSLNALVNACNQKSNREPVMSLDETAVSAALANLTDQNLAAGTSGRDSRVLKYEHRLQEAFNFDRLETAILCVLLLRGPQTPGELRSRTERMHRFDDLEQVQSTLQRLMKREPPIVAVLPRQPGTKEVRYAHLLSGELQIAVSAPEHGAVTSLRSSNDTERIARLEDAVARLEKELAETREHLAALQKQFE
ncbi:MAG: YceH family protein [Candidatus Acidiferrales bacterium]|jgi:uncharacterized protein YceH (UPF0502 family)|nr:YceH family protein [Candidatus Acidoferrales bacterium]